MLYHHLLDITKKFNPLKKENINHYAKIKKYMTIDIHKAIAKLPIIPRVYPFKYELLWYLFVY